MNTYTSISIIFRTEVEESNIFSNNYTLKIR
jgi:hypothetical protein